MNVKAAIALILGLVFQLAQAVPGAAVTMPCAPVAEACGCCAGPDSCPCAETGEPAQKPSPLSSDSGGILKIPVAKSAGPRVSLETVPETRQSVTLAACPPAGPPTGYHGVRLSVAFCSFVI
jgi:hypothetical protein